MKNFFLKLKSSHIIIASVLTIIILGIMDFYSLPAIEKAAGGIKAFDLQTFGYSFETANAFLNSLSEEGRSLFLHFQLPLDFIFSFVYTFLFLALFERLNKSGHRLIVFPIILFALDIAENTISIILLKSTELSHSIVAVGGTVTLLKNIFTLICSVIIIVFLIIFFVKRKQNKKS